MVRSSAEQEKNEKLQWRHCNTRVWPANVTAASTQMKPFFDLGKDFRTSSRLGFGGMVGALVESPAGRPDLSVLRKGVVV